MAAALAGMGCDIITGGGPGLMQAANEGAAAWPGRAQSVGIRVDLPFEQEVNAFVSDAFEHRTFFTRLHQFVLTSDAFVVAPGGIGTVLETMMVWQLLQVKHLHDTPLILVGKMWPGLIEWVRRSMMSRIHHSLERRTRQSRSACQTAMKRSTSCGRVTTRGQRVVRRQ